MIVVNVEQHHSMVRGSYSAQAVKIVRIQVPEIAHRDVETDGTFKWSDKVVPCE